jgi:tetratricopeptide (TPR) repeat protein
MIRVRRSRFADGNTEKFSRLADGEWRGAVNGGGKNGRAVGDHDALLGAMPMAPRGATSPANVPASPFRTLGWVALLGAITFAVYARTLSGSFLWNDRDYVTAAELRSPEGLALIWKQIGATEQYYPLLHSLFWVQQWVFGDVPTGYRVVNLALHLLGCVLLARVVARLLAPATHAADVRAERIGWLAAFLFAVHPVHVESVAWVAEQKNTLSLVLYLGAAWAYLRFLETRCGQDYALGLGLFVLSLLAKTVTATLPAALLVLSWWRHGRLEWRRDVRPLLPWLALGAGWGVFTSWVELHYLGAAGGEFDVGPLERVLVAGRAFWFYLGKVIWPSGLNFIYPRWELSPEIWANWLYPIGGLAIVGALVGWARGGTVESGRARRAPLAALLFFGGSLVPVLGFVNLYGARYSWVWDHWQYLPDLGLFVLAAAVLVGVGGRLPAARRWLGVTAIMALVAGLGGLSALHATWFRDNETLFVRTIARNPDAWMAYNNLAVERIDAGRFAEARTLVETSLRLHPRNAEAESNLGVVCREARDYERAVEHFGRALALNPQLPMARYGRGCALCDLRRFAEAVPDLEVAVKLTPNHVQARSQLGIALIQSGRSEEALPHLEEAAKLEPGALETQGNLGNAYLATRRYDQAIGRYEAALQIAPDNPPVLGNLRAALVGAGRVDEAIGRLEAALRKNPSSPMLEFQLALAYHAAGREAAVEAHLRRVQELDPNFAPSR